MLIPESWLRTFCNPRLPGRDLADKLTMAGLEVEAYEPAGSADVSGFGRGCQSGAELTTTTPLSVGPGGPTV